MERNENVKTETNALCAGARRYLDACNFIENIRVNAERLEMVGCETVW
jgi:hypothetical protein